MGTFVVSSVSVREFRRTHRKATMSRLLPSLALLAVVIAEGTLARSFKTADPSVQELVKSALSHRNKDYGYGNGYNGLSQGPSPQQYGYYGTFGKTSISRSAVDSCSEGGIQLTATSLPQTFGVLEY